MEKTLSPYRWLACGLILAVLFTVFPIIYTVYLSFTNMGGGHLLTKQQAIERILLERTSPEDAKIYTWTAYRNNSKDYLLLLADEEGILTTIRPGFDEEAFDGLEAPPTIKDYTILDPVEAIQQVQTISELRFGTTNKIFGTISMSEASVLKERFSYDSAKDEIVEIDSQRRFRAQEGTFVAEDGEELIPGFIVGIGTENYTRFLGNDGYRKPILQVIIWNFVFSLLSVAFSFGIGMLIAILFENLPGKRIIRSLLIIPYPIPVLVSIMVWRALLNEQMGLVTQIFENLFGWSPAFFTNIEWTRFAVILINVYLSYPYFYILCSGALKSISTDLYEAADIDGATRLQQLRLITMPMLLRILMPLLIASFSFNFNNFTIIWGFNSGNPAMADTIVPMGHSDLLISFIYRLGFNSASAAEYGFSAAITVVLFVFVGLMVFFQTRNTKAIKETL